MRILVSFYSRSGTTRKIGEQIASELSSDVEEFSDVVKRSGFIGWMRCGYQAMKEKVTKLKPVEKNPEDYDLVVIGTPIWGRNVSVPTRTYVTEMKGKFKNVAFYSTAGGSDGSEAFAAMENISNIKPVATLGLVRKEIKKELHHEKLKDFVGKIKK